MLHGNQTISHYSRGNVLVWFSMAFQAGALNVGGFMACHRFVSHVTGFATFFGYEVTQPKFGEAAGMLLVPCFFLLGSMFSAELVDIRIKLHKKPKYYVAFGVMFSLIFAVFLSGVMGWFGTFGEPLVLSRDYTLLALLCFVCGIQNGTITSASKSVVRTTHLSGITTDLGIGLVRALHRKKSMEPLSEEGKANFTRIGIIASFGLGSVAGGFAFKHYEYYGFLLPLLTSGALFTLMVYFQVLKKRST